MAASGAKPSVFLLPGILARPLWDCDGARRSCRAQKDVYPQYPADGRADVGHWSVANLRLDGHSRPLLLLLMRILQGRPSAVKCRGVGVCREHVPARRIGIACGTLTRGLTVGFCSFRGRDNCEYQHDATGRTRLGWRLAVPAGRAFSSVAMYPRRWLQRDTDFPRNAAAQSAGYKSCLLRRRRCVIKKRWWCQCCLPGCSRQALWCGDFDVAGLAAKQYGFAPGGDLLQANSIATVMLCFGCLAAGLAVDRFGASVTFIVGSLLLAARWAFYHLAGSPEQLFLLYGVVGLCVGGGGGAYDGSGPSCQKSASPILFSYNVSYAISSVD